MEKNKKITTIKVKEIQKDIFLKMLSKDLFITFNGIFTKENTIIVNDSLVKHTLNDLENVLLLVS